MTSKYLPKPLRLSPGFMADHVARKLPYASTASYYAVWTRNRVPAWVSAVLTVIIPVLFLYTLFHYGPNINEAPSEVTGKVATINMITTLFVAGNLIILVIRCLRRPIPRGEHF